MAILAFTVNILKQSGQPIIGFLNPDADDMEYSFENFNAELWVLLQQAIEIVTG